MLSKVYFINPFDLLHFDCLLRLDDLAAQQHTAYTAWKEKRGDLQPGSWPKKIGVWWPKTFSVLVGLAHPRTFLRKRFASFQCLKGFIVLYPLWKQWRNVPVLSWWKHIPVLQIPIRTVTQSIAQPIPRISVLLMGSVQRLWHCYILPHGNLHYTILATQVE